MSPKSIYIVWVRDVDLSYKFCSAWWNEQHAYDQCRKLQKQDYELAYFVTEELVS
jgi:hypothetical protein